MRKSGQRVEPIHWFVVTNSSDAGLGSGTVNTDRMFKALGRQDVMPKVAIKNNPEIEAAYNKLKPKAPIVNRGNSPAEIKKMTEIYQQQMKDFPQVEDNFLKSLKKDFSKVAGIKCHICVLHSMDSDPKNWQEIYIHSKVTMIDDVFLTMGSANINTRSMQADTEINLALEHGETVKKMRRSIWHLNTANPESMHLNTTAKKAFEIWEKLVKKNNELKNSKQKPQQPLTEFLRLSPSISNKD